MYIYIYIYIFFKLESFPQNLVVGIVVDRCVVDKLFFIKYFLNCFEGMKIAFFNVITTSTSRFSSLFAVVHSLD